MSVRIQDQTPEHREAVAERRRARDREKSKRRKAKARALKIAQSPVVAPSKTDPVTRRRLYGEAPTMSKDRLRAVIAEACANTAEMAI